MTSTLRNIDEEKRHVWHVVMTKVGHKNMEKYLARKCSIRALHSIY
jgi:hypothetical protein